MRIGIWCNTQIKIEEIFTYIVNEYKEQIYRAQYNKWSGMIQFNNGDRIDIVPAFAITKGYRFDKIYVDENIDQEFYWRVICPHIINTEHIDNPIQIFFKNQGQYKTIPAKEYFLAKENK